MLHRQTNQRLRRIGNDGRFFIRQIGGGAAVYRHVFLRQLQQAQDLLIAFLHAVRRAGGALVLEGRGAQRQQTHPVGRAQGIGNRKLIVNFIIGVGVDHQIDKALGRFQHVQTLFRGQHRSSSFLFKAAKILRACFFVSASLSCKSKNTIKQRHFPVKPKFGTFRGAFSNFSLFCQTAHLTAIPIIQNVSFCKQCFRAMQSGKRRLEA